MKHLVNLCDGAECIAHLGTIDRPWENIPGAVLLETECCAAEIEDINGVDCCCDPDADFALFHEIATQPLQFEGPAYGEASDNVGLAMLSSPERLPNVWPATLAYNYDTTGAGVLIYQIDSKAADNPTFAGNVNDLAGRVTLIYDAHNAAPHDHGCAVAGIMAGTRFGVAKGAHVYCAAATNGTGTLSQIIGGFNAIIGHYAGRSEPAVINASVAGEAGSNPLSAAISACRDAGLLIVAGAGNASKDGATTWPAADPRCISVGAIGWQEVMSSFSNFGPTVDIFALGENASVDGWTKHGWLGGTSASAPFVAGLVARLLEGRARLSATKVGALHSEVLALANDRATVPAGTTGRVAYIPGAVPATSAGIRISILA